MPRCPTACEICKDKTCKQYYKKHWTCGTHNLHIGDNVRRISDGKLGYIYDSNPYGSKRSVFIMWNDLIGEDAGTLVWGHKACLDFEKTGGRTTRKTSDT